jgi:hypothetical protein
VSETGESQGVVEVLYRLDSVAPTTAPDGSDATWYRYVIIQGANVITGLRPGTLAELNPVLQEMVDRLNERAGRQRAKTHK